MSFPRPNRPMGNMGFPNFTSRPPPGMMMGNRGPPMNIPPPNMGNGPPPMMQRHMPPRPNLPPNQNQLANKSKLVKQDISEVEDGEITKPPVTTVFVGSISDRAPDNMIRTLLQRCGNIVSWKRVQGADGKLQAFGFCEFEIPEATLRCMRLLNDWPIADKKLVVKVDDKTKDMLEEYEKNHATEEDEVKREDRLALAALDAVMREFAAELRRNAPPAPAGTPRHPREQFGVVASGPKADEGLDGVVKDEDAKNLINREINRFREAYKDDEVVTEIKPGSRDPTKKEAPVRRRESPERRARERERERRSEKPVERERDRDRKPEREEKEERRVCRSRSKENIRRVERSRSPRKREDPEEDPDERYERLRLERQLRDKERAYQERLKNWEVRERKKIREFERERQRSEERKAEEKKEARRLREFLEDYDDERDDSKYYKSTALNRRMKEREKEAEADARDRHKEREEMEELRKKLVAEGHPNPDAEINRRQNPNAAPEVEIQDSPSEQAPATSGIQDNMAYEQNSRVVESMQEMSVAANGDTVDSSEEMSHSDDAHRKKRLTVKDVFNNDDDKTDDKKKRPLVPLDYEESKRKPKKLSSEEKKAAIKQLIEQIPTEKSELFAWHMNWDMVDKALLDSRIKPWVNKKISEYIGEEEATLTDFICQKVMGKSSAQSILTDVAMVLDDEAETFVVKMWRLLVYETEAKKAGLV
ncbi:RNA-binding protein 25-like [Watersipora subatra]|uniref:RNA-binding protein 25-like n=1 Tax=Watersipora subatra TaxID=2589382 RepID=UPI00355B3E0A